MATYRQIQPLSCAADDDDEEDAARVSSSACGSPGGGSAGGSHGGAPRAEGAVAAARVGRENERERRGEGWEAEVSGRRSGSGGIYLFARIRRRSWRSEREAEENPEK